MYTVALCTPQLKPPVVEGGWKHSDKALDGRVQLGLD